MRSWYYDEQQTLVSSIPLNPSLKWYENRNSLYIQKRVTSFHRATSLGGNRRINNHLLLSAIAAALRKEGDRHCQKRLKLVSQAEKLQTFFPMLYNARKCILSASKRVQQKYIESILSLWQQLLFICVNILFRQKYGITQQSQMSLFTYLSLWNSSNAVSHAATENKSTCYYQQLRKHKNSQS